MAVWESVDIARLKIGDEVRVRRNAYRTYDVGKLHNGRICKVIGFGNGDVIVKSIDGARPLLSSTAHPPHYLEIKRSVQ